MKLTDVSPVIFGGIQGKRYLGAFGTEQKVSRLRIFGAVNMWTVQAKLIPYIMYGA